MYNREEILHELIRQFDIGYELSYRYDRILHFYGDEILYHTEIHLVQAIGRDPGVTIATIAASMPKSKSAYSQMVHKLVNKGLVTQVRDENNRRKQKLYLTEKGWKLFELHESFDNDCMNRTYGYLDAFSIEDLQTYIAVQKQLNQAYALDVKESEEMLEQAALSSKQ